MSLYIFIIVCMSSTDLSNISTLVNMSLYVLSSCPHDLVNDFEFHFVLYHYIIYDQIMYDME